MSNKQLVGNRLFIKTKKGDISLPLDYQDDNQIANKPFIPHRAITHYGDVDPFDISVDFGIDWMKCLVSADLSTYTLFFKHTYDGGDFPIRVLTDWDLFNDNNINCVKITANEDSVLTLFNEGDNTPNLQYSTNGVVWNDYTEQIAIKKGSSILLRGDNLNGFSFNTNIYSHIQILGNVSLSGNIMGLLDNGTGSLIVIPNSYCFYNLFRDSTGITSVSENFLPATTLTEGCYSCMFYKCASLTTAPELPATSLTQECYMGMFYNNKSLRIAPTLPATTLAESCYESMFRSCSSLFSVKIAYTGNFADTTDAFSGWLSGTPSYALIYYNGSDTTTGASAIPTGWVKVTF